MLYVTRVTYGPFLHKRKRSSRDPSFFGGLKDTVNEQDLYKSQKHNVVKLK